MLVLERWFSRVAVNIPAMVKEDLKHSLGADLSSCKLSCATNCAAVVEQAAEEVGSVSFHRLDDEALEVGGSGGGKRSRGMPLGEEGLQVPEGVCVDCVG